YRVCDAPSPCDLLCVSPLHSSARRRPHCFCPLSLHDALPISPRPPGPGRAPRAPCCGPHCGQVPAAERRLGTLARVKILVIGSRSEEHTSERQSRFDLVCRLLLEKKKNKHQE